MAKIGVLALQGDFLEHVRALRKLDVQAEEVRQPRDLAGVDGVVIPGGESTTISRLMKEFELVEPLKDLHQRGIPLWGTCAGLILLATKVIDDHEVIEPLALIDLTVRRNAFGRQVDSFEQDLSVPKLGEAPFPGVFIRAPAVERLGEDVEVLARLPNGTPVAAQQNSVLVTAFHPELTQDPRFHAYFISKVTQREKR